MSGQSSVVRDFQRGDVEAVSRLFLRTFRNRASAKASPSLIGVIEQSFLDHPWTVPGISSKVVAGEGGHISGFVGIIPARLDFDGRPVTAAFAGSMMVEDPKADPLAGARLLRAFLAGPQDLSLTETANLTSLGMWQKLGHALEPGYSLSWMRILRPVSAGLQILERSVPAARIARPFGRIADRAVALVRPMPAAPMHGRRIAFSDAAPEEFGRALLALKSVYAMRPDWKGDSIAWFLGQAEQKRNFGHPEWRVAYGTNGSPVAAYAYFNRPGGIGWVLQALSVPARAGDLVDDMFDHAYAMGGAGLRGSAHPWLAAALMPRRAIFTGRAFYLAHARDTSLLQPIRAGEALISGLAGESWMRLIGDRFDD